MNDFAARAGAAGAVESIHVAGEIAKRMGYQLSESTLVAIDAAFWIAAFLVGWALVPYLARVLVFSGTTITVLHSRITNRIFWSVRHFGGILIRGFRRKSTVRNDHKKT